MTVTFKEVVVANLGTPTLAVALMAAVTTLVDLRNAVAEAIGDGTDETSTEHGSGTEAPPTEHDAGG